MSLAGLRLDEAYARKFPTSEKLYRRALELFPSGVTHDARWLAPFAVYVERARGSRKWDVDGNELIDYWMGHGALLLGHGHPAIVQAVQDQLQRGTHYGACHPLEVEWAEWVRRLMPAAERVRFTNSGTEATHLAMRLARAFSGKSRVVKFEGHFHGWHDYAARSARGPLLEDRLPGIPQETLEATLVAPVHDPAALEQILRGRDDVAAVIVEPSGGGWGELPLR
ncbi:MAG TPA: aminotransferase class III-fold pyridoxal phosphate-dependent enzyme, partial [Limnochordales bacterium]